MKQLKLFKKERWKLIVYERNWVTGSNHRLSFLNRIEYEGNKDWIDGIEEWAKRDPNNNKYIKKVKIH